MRWLLAAAALSGCISTAITGEEPADARVLVITDATDAPAPDSDGVVADAGMGDRAPVDAGGTDASRVGPPTVPGPPAETYDCRAESAVEVRRSPVPLDCIFDATCREPMVVGHRGAGGPLGSIAPENSLAAIRAALVMGVDGVELDVQHTVDDALVLMRDESVERTTFGRGRVDTLSLEAVTALTLRPPPNGAAEGDFGCERVPTLAEALELTRDRLMVHLDVKTARVDLVVAAIRVADLYDQVLFRTRSVSTAARAREMDPAIRVQIRVDNREEYDGMMARLDWPAEVVEIDPGQVDELSATIRFDGQSVLVESFVEDAVALVRGGMVYTDLYDGGADVLQTEFPPLVLQTLGR